MKTIQRYGILLSLSLCLYPTFKEWKLKVNRDLDNDYSVYILPLRNENLYPLGWQAYLRGGLYPTFKEWKPKSCVITDSISSVYILPLRNEN